MAEMTIPKLPKIPKPKKFKKLKFKKLGSKVRALAKTGAIGPKQLAKLRGSKLRGSQIATAAPRGGVTKGMAGM